MGGFEAKGCCFQLGPMGVNNLPIEGGFLPQNLFIAWEGEMVDGLVQKFCQKLNTFMGGEGAKGKLKPRTLGWSVIWVPSSATIVTTLNGPS